MSTIIPYAPVPSKPQLWARLLRFVLIALFIAFIGVAIGFLFHWPERLVDDSWGSGLWGTAILPIDETNQSHWYTMPGDVPSTVFYLVSSIFLALVFLGQWLFLLPRGSWKLRLDESPRPMRRAAIVAGAIAMLLTTGLAASLLDFGNLWERIFVVEPINSHGGLQDFRLLWVIMLVIWAAWALTFLSYFRTLDGYTGLTKVFRFLLAGTVLELLVASPVLALKESKNDCFCAKGSYTGLVFGCTCAFWLFGPGIFLLFLREKRRMG